ncbi:MAG: GtrA family protein [Akkermansiaceae bacterium]|nr:GtrA family protein [Akkermansiaceae bacterium]
MIARLIGEAWSHCREHGFKKTLLSRDTPFLIQFGKYGVCGVLSVVVFMAVAKTGEHFYPEQFSLDLSEGQRAKNLFVLHLFAFLPSNLTAYALNRWLVFTPGRHSNRKELSLFTLISFISFAIGELIPVWLVNSFNVPNNVAHLSFVISSAMVNFVCRKFLVFEK